MPISRRGLTAAGLALATVVAIGVTSTLDAGAAQVAQAPATTSGPDADLPTPPPPLPGDATRKSASKATGSVFSAQDADADPAGTPLVPTPRYAPKGMPGLPASRATKQESSLSAQSLGGQTQALQAPAPTEHFLWASASQAVPPAVKADGIYATMTIGRPELARKDFHSLAEIAVRSADGRQIVEVGWTVDRHVNKESAEPHLFVYHWVDRKPGCYNGCGYVQVHDSIKPGSALPVGKAKRFGIQHFDNKWWINYANQWIGYFPDGLWDCSTPVPCPATPVEFEQVELAQWWGEVAAASPETCTDMGTGIPAKKKGAAEIRNINLIIGAEFVPATIASGASSAHYGVSQGVDVTNAFRYGGEGTGPC